MIRSWSRLLTASSPSVISSQTASSAACARGTRLTGIPNGVEAGLEEGHEPAGQRVVGGERRLDVLLGERRPGLAQVLRDRAQDDDLTPGQPRPEDEGVEPVALGPATPDRTDRVLEELTQAVSAAVAAGPDLLALDAQPEVVDPQPDPVTALDLVGAFVDHLDTHVGEHRQDLGQRQRAAPVELEAPLVHRSAGLLVHVEAGRVVALERVHVTDVGDPDPRAEVLLVGLGEGARVEAGQPRSGLLAVLAAGRLAEVLLPGAGGVDQLPLEGGLVDVGDGLTGRHADDEVQHGQHGLGHACREVHRRARERLPQNGFHLEPDAGVVAVARDVDQAGDEAAEPVATQEQLGLATLLQVEDGRRVLEQRLLVGLEQLVARVVLEHLEQVLAGVRVGQEATALEDRRDLVTHDRDPRHRLGVGAGREEPEEALLAGHLPRRRRTA